MPTGWEGDCQAPTPRCVAFGFQVSDQVSGRLSSLCVFQFRRHLSFGHWQGVFTECVGLKGVDTHHIV